MFGVEGREGDPQRVLQTVCRLWRANWRGKMKGEGVRNGTIVHGESLGTTGGRCKREKQAVAGSFCG